MSECVSVLGACNRKMYVETFHVFSVHVHSSLSVNSCSSPSDHNNYFQTFIHMFNTNHIVIQFIYILFHFNPTTPNNKPIFLLSTFHTEWTIDLLVKTTHKIYQTLQLKTPTHHYETLLNSADILLWKVAMKRQGLITSLIRTTGAGPSLNLICQPRWSME